MTPGRLNKVLGNARAFLRADTRSDAELLATFLHTRDEQAFQTLLSRHTPAVRAACRGWLRAEADIDDAAQATFLVFVQRAESIRNKATLGPWLYGVATNVARRLKRQQRSLAPLTNELPQRESSSDDELRHVLAEEIARLPEKYRLPVQLCYSVGLTTSEAAERLGWPKGTVLTRLAWARERLQKLLTHRGVSPGILAGMLMATSTQAVNGAWLRATATAALSLVAGETGTGVSARTLTLTQGVVNAMVFDRMKYIVLALLVAVGLAGFGLHHWATASEGPETARKLDRDEPNDPRPANRVANKERDADPQAAAPGRRREIVIRMPLGAFVKEVDVPGYGSGRVTWTYEDDRVLGLIEGSAMGFEMEVATEAEYSLSSNGTIYGLLTSVRLNHLRLPEGKGFEEFKPFVALWPVAEPLVTEALTDLPFSYKFRVTGDRLVISNFRMLLAGPNPLGKLGGLGLGSGGKEATAALMAFQAMGTAFEGTYTTPEAKEKPGRKPLFMKRGEGKKGR